MAGRCKIARSGPGEMPVGRDKAIEIRQLVLVAVADSLDAIKRDAAHLGQTGDCGCLHIHQPGPVGSGQAPLLRRICNPRTGRQPQIWVPQVSILRPGRRIDRIPNKLPAETLPGARIDHPGDAIGLARHNLLAQSPRPAGGNRQIDGTVLFDFGKGARCGIHAGPGTGGHPLAVIEAPSARDRRRCGVRAASRAPEASTLRAWRR